MNYNDAVKLWDKLHQENIFQLCSSHRLTIRYDTIGEFNVDSKAEYSALSSTRSQKKTKTNKRQCPFKS